MRPRAHGVWSRPRMSRWTRETWRRSKTSGRDHFAIPYFRFVKRMYRDRLETSVAAIVDHVRRRMPTAGYHEIRLQCDVDGEPPDGRLFGGVFRKHGFRRHGGCMKLVLRRNDERRSRR